MHKFSVRNLLNLTNSIKELSFRLVINDDLIGKLISHKTTSNTKFSNSLFTIKNFIKANELLLADIENDDLELVCRDYWHSVINVTSEWKTIIDNEELAIEQRTTYINCQPYALNAYAIVGNYLLKRHMDSYRPRLAWISNLKWNEDNNHWKIKKMAFSGDANAMAVAVQLMLKAYLHIPICDKEEIAYNVIINEFIMLFNDTCEKLDVNIDAYPSSCEYKRFN